MKQLSFLNHPQRYQDLSRLKRVMLNKCALYELEKRTFTFTDEELEVHAIRLWYEACIDLMNDGYLYRDGHKWFPTKAGRKLLDDHFQWMRDNGRLWTD